MGDRWDARRRLVAATAALLAVATAGCSSDGGDGQAVTTIGAAAVQQVVTTVAGTTTTTPAPATTVAPAVAAVTVPIDAAALLQQSIAAIAGGYHFRTGVTIDSAEVLVAEGDRVGDGTRLTIWANGTSVAYAITPAGSWVFPEGGEWEALDTPPATTDPLGALTAPLAVTGTSPDGVAASIVATVAASALGVPGAGNADLQVQLAGTTLSEVSYLTTVDGRPASVRSILGPVVDTTPVAAPI